MITRDEHAKSQMMQTAQAFQKLAALRGIACNVDVNNDCNYTINGVAIGCSILSCYDWLNNQPNVKP